MRRAVTISNSVLDRLLRLAAIAGDENGLTLHLTKGANPNSIDSVGRTPLTYAVLGEKTRICEILIDWGADSSIADNQGNSPIYFAKELQNVEIADLLNSQTKIGIDLGSVSEMPSLASPASLDIEGDLDSGAWESEASPEAPKGNPSVEQSLRTTSLSIASFIRIEDALDWSDVLVDLPYPRELESRIKPLISDLVAFLELCILQGSVNIAEWEVLTTRHFEVEEEIFEATLFWIASEFGLHVYGENQLETLSADFSATVSEELLEFSDELYFHLEEVAASKGDVLFSYYLDLSRYSLLTAEEEVSLATALHDRDTEILMCACSNPAILDELIWQLQNELHNSEVSNCATPEGKSKIHDSGLGIGDFLDTGELYEPQNSVFFGADTRTAKDVLTILKESREAEADEKFARVHSHVQRLKPTFEAFDLVSKSLQTQGRFDQPLAQLLSSRRVLRDRFVAANLKLVISIAKKYFRTGVPFLDLIQEGNLGLMKAVERFDYTKGFRFSTYASAWIKQKIKRYIQDSGRVVRLPVYLEERIRVIHQIVAEHEDQFGISPNLGMISQLAGLTENRALSVILADATILSLNDVNLDEITLVGLDGQAPAEARDIQGLLEQRELQVLLGDLLKQLDQRGARVLRLRHGLGIDASMTLEEIGKIFGVTRERVRQIEAKSLKKLRIPRLLMPLEGYFPLEKISRVGDDA